MPDVIFPDIALPQATDPGRPLADVVFYRLLTEHPALTGLGLTVDLEHEPSTRTPPWVRVGVVRRLERTRPGEETPIAALDVFDVEHLKAADLAATIARVWPYLKKVRIESEAAFVSGAWVEVEPFRLSEPDDSGTGEGVARFHLEVGIRLHPTPLGA